MIPAGPGVHDCAQGFNKLFSLSLLDKAHLPKVIFIGVFGNRIFCIDVSNQRTKPGSFGDKLLGPNSNHLKQNIINLSQ